MKKIAVVYGGFSSEVEISIKSGKTVAAWLRNAGYQVYEILLTKEQWCVVEGEKKYPVDKNDFSCTIGSEKIKFDKVFIIIHGDPGENGLLQAYFEMLDIPFIGSSSLVTSIAFDKYACKSYLKGKGVHLAKDLYIRKGEPITTEEILKDLKLPVFVKPTNGGSSFGVSKVKKEEELAAALEVAFKEGDGVLIEEGIVGREIDCGVYKDNKGTHALPLIEIVSKNEFFDYEAKYLGASDEICPAPIDEQTTLRVQQEAIKIFDILGCTGLMRYDFIVTEEGIPYFLEANPNPGMTAASLLPQMVAEAGIRMEDFLSALIEDK